METGSSEEGCSIQGGCLSKVKVIPLSTKVSDSMREGREPQEDRNLEKRYSQSPIVAALTPECSKARD